MLDVPGLQHAGSLGVGDCGRYNCVYKLCKVRVRVRVRATASRDLPQSPQFWRRYVDDTCAALPLDLVDSFHKHLNSIGPCIQFTMEKESDGQLPFLDILLS